MTFDFEIRRTDDLMYVRLAGRFSMAAIWAVNEDFWRHWEPSLNRILMDYRALSSVDLAVREFIKAGLDSQEAIPVQGDNVRAVYLSESDVVFGFTRIIEQVWEDHVSVRATRDVGEAFDFLGIEAGALETARPVSSGHLEH